MGSCQRRWLFCVTLPRVHPTFLQRVHWHTATYPAVEALIPFLSPTSLSFWLLWSPPGKIVNIVVLLWANMKRKHVFSHLFIIYYYLLFLLHCLHIVFVPAFNGEHIHPLSSSDMAPLCQIITVKSFMAAQRMFTAIFSWINMNNICQRTAHQIRGNVNAAHSDSVCASGQEISKAWTTIFFCFQPVFHNLKGAKGSYLYLIWLNRPISQPSAAAVLHSSILGEFGLHYCCGLFYTSPIKKDCKSHNLLVKSNCHTNHSFLLWMSVSLWDFWLQIRGCIVAQKPLLKLHNLKPRAALHLSHLDHLRILAWESVAPSGTWPQSFLFFSFFFQPRQGFAMLANLCKLLPQCSAVNVIIMLQHVGSFTDDVGCNQFIFDCLLTLCYLQQICPLSSDHSHCL